MLDDDEEVYRKHAAELFRYATALVGPMGAADVVADAIVSVFGSDDWASVQNRRAYLYRAVLNAARQTNRESQRRLRREARGHIAQDPDRSADVRVEVLDAVRALSLRQRSIVFFTYWHDLTPVDIARHLQVSTRTVQRDLVRAHRRMGQVLDDL